MTAAVLGIDLGGAASATTGYAVLTPTCGSAPRLAEHGVLPKGSDPAASEAALRALVRRANVEVVAIDAPLTLPPCLRCSEACRGPGDACESPEARRMWSDGENPIAGRCCEVWVRTNIGCRPLPTMQLGALTARAVVLARELARQGKPKVIEVYPRATLARLSTRDPDLALRAPGEPRGSFSARVARGFGRLISGIPSSASGHVLDAIAAAYTAWLWPGGVEEPPPEWPVHSGWIYVPS